MSRVVHLAAHAPPVLAWCDGDRAASLLAGRSTARIRLHFPISEKQFPVPTGRPGRSCKLGSRAWRSCSECMPSNAQSATR